MTKDESPVQASDSSPPLAPLCPFTEEDDPLDILRWTMANDPDPKNRISAAKTLAEFDHHKKKALDEHQVDDLAVKINFNIDHLPTKNARNNSRLHSVSDDTPLPPE